MDYSGVNEKLDLSKNDAVIHLYFRSDMTAHYVAGISNGDGTFCFYNSDTGNTSPMTWKDYLCSTNIKNKDNIIYSCVYKVNIKG